MFWNKRKKEKGLRDKGFISITEKGMMTAIPGDSIGANICTLAVINVLINDEHTRKAINAEVLRMTSPVNKGEVDGK